MSLINQMLKDLEGRAKQPVPAETVLTGLQLSVSQQQSNKNRWLKLSVLALICIWMWDLASYYRHYHRAMPAVKKEASAVTAPVGKPALQLQTVKPAFPAVANQGKEALAAGALMGISMQAHGKMTYVRFLLDREVFYRVNSDPLEHSITLILNNTRLNVNLPPLDFINSALRDVQVSAEAGNRLKIILLLKPEARLGNLELNKESKYPELQADFLLETTTTTAAPQALPLLGAAAVPESHLEQPAGHWKKVVLELSDDEQYQNALHLAEQGQLPAAIQRLAILVGKYPNDSVARESLIRFLIQGEHQEEAEECLAAGLRLQPHYPPFIEIKARFLVNEGKVFQALHLLKKAPPALASNPEYYSFLAALYQRLGQLPAAENLYQQLTALHPEKGVWWLGLAVTEDALGKTAQALEAYAKADRSPDLDPELRGYVGTRLRG